MRLEVLGCSGGIGGALRTTSFLVDHDVLIDAGTGANDLSLAQLARINHVFLTHSHLDHIAAIPWIVDTVGSLRDQPLVVHALDATIRTLKDHIFNWRIWPDFTRIPNPERPYLRFESMMTGTQINLAERTFVPIPANHVVPTWLSHRQRSKQSDFQWRYRAERSLVANSEPMRQFAVPLD